MNKPAAPKWNTSDLPDLTGRTVIVTGANSGLGFCTTEALAAHGAKVTMAVRDLEKGNLAAGRIRALAPAAQVELARLDLADLTSVRAFAKDWALANPQGLDLLINNAGIMAIPKRVTADGFEMQIGTNHLGHFALTGLLLPALVAVPNSRVVTVASQAHRMGRMNFDDLMGDQNYRQWRAYGQSKLANLLFTAELQRRIDQARLSILALAAHPGFASTNLQSVGPSMRGSTVEAKLTALSGNIMSQSAAMGALPTLFAATAPGLAGDTYVGPDGFLETRGYPKIVGRSKAALNYADARQLWQVSEQLTGVIYPFY
ncbi:short-chain dehydrogenase [Actinomycetes bacterium]|nr:short-chain dehydrogenase [Actinomycetes bacterium]